MSPSDLRAAFFRKPWVRFKNASGEVIPPFAVMRVTGSTSNNNSLLYTVAKPDSTFRRCYLVNGPFTVGSGSSKEGLGTFLSEGGYVQVDTTGSYTVGNEFGPKSGDWRLAGVRYGFVLEGTGYEPVLSPAIQVAAFRQRIVTTVLGKCLSAGVQNGATVTVTAISNTGGASLSQTVSTVYNYGRYIFGGATNNEIVVLDFSGEFPTIRPLNNTSTVQGVPDSSIAANSTGTVSLYIGGVDSGDDVTALNGTAAAVDNTKTHFVTMYDAGSYVIL